MYDVYDNCPLSPFPATGDAGAGTPRTTLGFLERARGPTLTGGYEWACGGMMALGAYFSRPDVVKALHLPAPNLSPFSYNQSGPASVTLYPALVKQLRVLIYNGDADSCVPYLGNEEWTTGLAAAGHVSETAAWHPWYATNATGRVPAGYATRYAVTGAPDRDFHFITIRLAGHMVPTFRPGAALAFFERWLAGGTF